MKTYNNSTEYYNTPETRNRNNWAAVKEMGEQLGANAYDYIIIVRKNGERLTSSDRETWAENTKGLRLASVAYCLCWIACEYDPYTRKELEAKGEKLTRGYSQVYDFTKDEAGYIEFCEEVVMNNDRTICEYYNGTTGATEETEGVSNTIAQDYAEKTGKSEKYEYLQNAMNGLYDIWKVAAKAVGKTLNAFSKDLTPESKAAWLEAEEKRHELDERDARLQEVWTECNEAWNEYHAPRIAATLARLEALENETKKLKAEINGTEATETATEGETVAEPDNSKAETENEPQSEKIVYSYGVKDVDGLFQTDDHYFDTVAECEADIMSKGETFLKYWREFEIYATLASEAGQDGQTDRVVKRMSYKRGRMVASYDPQEPQAETLARLQEVQKNNNKPMFC